MRTLNLDGAGAKNQDRSIQPSAIVGELPPFALAPKPPATPPPAPGGNPPAAPGHKPKVTSPPTTTIAGPATDGGAAPGVVAFVVIAGLAVLLATSRRRRPVRQ
jgi:MYXO-CTERM domain-containing protein